MSSSRQTQITAAVIREGQPHLESEVRQMPWTPGKLAEEAWVFYDVGRLSHNFTVHAGVIRRMLPELRLGPVERPIYREWLETDAFTATDKARNRQPLSDLEVTALRAVSDPAVLASDALRHTYSELHPGSERDVRLWQRAADGFDTVLISIHGPHPSHLKSVVEMYESTVPTIDPAA
jgi:hypothetical protein